VKLGKAGRVPGPTNGSSNFLSGIAEKLVAVLHSLYELQKISTEPIYSLQTSVGWTSSEAIAESHLVGINKALKRP
jgi:hypothetical protein